MPIDPIHYVIFRQYHIITLKKNMQNQITMQRKQYLKYPKSPSIQQHICIICFDTIIEPVICLGSCHRRVCRECANTSKINKDQCPYKCSSPWRFKIIQPSPLQYFCPFNEGCKIQFSEHFIPHIENCQFKTYELFVNQIPKKHYFCRKGHNLEFFYDSFKVMSSSVCSQCRCVISVRSKCSKCDQLYCVKCRPIPSSKQMCAIGHPYKLIKPNPGLVCDSCGLNPNFVGQWVYSDSQCNFDICYLCYQKLPSFPTRLLFDPKHYCEKSHKLSYLNSTRQALCGNCERQRTCLKYCPECIQSYCLKCKPIRVLGLKCELNHSLFELPEEEQLTCHLCEKSNKSIFMDEGCGFVVCIECVQTCEEKALQKMLVTCQNNHRLNIISASTHKCRQCGLDVRLKLECECCHTYYCFKCKPFKIQGEKCWVGHDMFQYSVQQGRPKEECMLCHSKGSKFLSCSFCEILVCQICQWRYRQ